MFIAILNAYRIAAEGEQSLDITVIAIGLAMKAHAILFKYSYLQIEDDRSLVDKAKDAVSHAGKK